ncbi:MAG: tRNA 2-thiouridine(34) synthase MnmA [Phycisphaerae bacterium]|nr:tRNA 2-thiouridine(34) synthase MnmA [Phycisphaerae bacterium]
MSRNGRVLVAMSGGVDSCVAAAMLRAAGYDVVGVFMRLGSEAAHGGQAMLAASDETRCDSSLGSAGMSLPLAPADRTRGCCSASDASDARTVAARLGIPFHSLNFQPDFDRLIDYFADEYVRGRTPNPCVRCNQWLKFGRLEAYADVFEAEFIATGHYARVTHASDGPRLFRARDRRKDQSYVLFGVSRDVLRRTLFPIGELSKEEVRAEARRMGLAVFDKPESQDICFVPDGDYWSVVSRRRPAALRPGEIRHIDGRLVGTHTGVASFTIGQRRGVRVALGEPVYVTALDAASGVVTVGPREALFSGGLIAADVRWIRPPDDRNAAIRAAVQIRYHHQPVPATLDVLDGGDVRVAFDAPVEAATPGQAAVFYDGDEVLGGGWIAKSVGAGHFERATSVSEPRP